MYSLEELEVFLKHEQEKVEKCEDDYTKQLLLNRCKMYQNAISDIKDRVDIPSDKENTDAVCDK